MPMCEKLWANVEISWNGPRSGQSKPKFIEKHKVYIEPLLNQRHKLHNILSSRRGRPFAFWQMMGKTEDWMAITWVNSKSKRWTLNTTPPINALELNYAGLWEKEKSGQTQMKEPMGHIEHITFDNTLYPCNVYFNRLFHTYKKVLTRTYPQIQMNTHSSSAKLVESRQLLRWIFHILLCFFLRPDTLASYIYLMIARTCTRHQMKSIIFAP